MGAQLFNDFLRERRIGLDQLLELPALFVSSDVIEHQGNRTST
jgi:hypothetical protein